MVETNLNQNKLPTRGLIMLGIPGGPHFNIEIDLSRRTSRTRLTLGDKDQYYALLEYLARQVLTGPIPGSDRTSRLRKKRRKALMSIGPALVRFCHVESYQVPVRSGSLEILRGLA